MSQVAELRQRLLDAFDDEILFASALRDTSDGGLEWALRELEGHRVRDVLEIGTCHGVMAAVLGLVATRVTTIDVADFQPCHPKTAPGGAAAFARVREVLDTAGTDNVWAVLAKDNREKEKIVSRLRFDAAFIDALHTEAGVRADFEAVKRCGFVLFHNAKTQSDVKEFLAGLPSLKRHGDFALWRVNDG